MEPIADDTSQASVWSNAQQETRWIGVGLACPEDGGNTDEVGREEDIDVPVSAVTEDEIWECPIMTLGGLADGHGRVEL